MNERTTSSSWALAIVQALELGGVDCLSLFAELGMDYAALSDPDARFPQDGMTRLWQRAVALSGNPAIGLNMAKVPYYRVLELEPSLNWPRPNFPVTNFLHGGAAPLNAILAAGEMGLANNIGIYPDGRFSYQLTIYIFRYGEGTVMAIMHPDNPIAKKSVQRYMQAMKSVCVSVADSGTWGRVA